MSDSPPEKDVQWSEEGIAASFKFVQKLWNLHTITVDEIKKNNSQDIDNELSKFTNKFIKKISNNLDSFSYNIIIANLHELYSHLIKEIKKGYKPETIKENYTKLLITLMPVIPHYSNECLQTIKKTDEIIWPTYDESQLEESTVVIVVQINGKKRGIINTKKDIDESDLMKSIYSDEKITKYFDKKEIKKKIFIKNKLINIIA